MFTGLIKEIGLIKNITTNSEGKLFTIECPKLACHIKIDDSVATNGVCLTATKVSEKNYSAQAVHTTLEKSTLGKLKIGDLVNLELAMLPTDRLGGHFVQGHVNTTAKLESIVHKGDNKDITLKVPTEQMKFIIDEGSIAIDGISLTVAKVSGDRITLTIIPHTWENTNLSQKRVGDEFNIEVDMIAKYLWNFKKFS